MIFEKWEEVIKLGKIADAVVIGLQVGSEGMGEAHDPGSTTRRSSRSIRFSRL